MITCPDNFLTNTNPVEYTVPTAEDNFDQSPDVTCSPAPMTDFDDGMTQVTCITTDHVGNMESCTFVVTLGMVSRFSESLCNAIHVCVNGNVNSLNHCTATGIVYTHPPFFFCI